MEIHLNGILNIYKHSCISLLGQTHFVELFHLLMELHHGLQRGVLVGDAGAVGGGAQAALLVPGVPCHQPLSHPLYVAPQ